MLLLGPNEKVLLQMRRHWYVLVGPVAVFIFLISLPAIFTNFAPRFFPATGSAEVKPIISFFTAVWLMAVFTSMLLQWLSYYLDVWIITDQRIIDVEQRGLFHRTVSEIAMDRVQDVTVEIPGFVPTVLKFGTIRIQTAGEQGEFVISEVPDCDKAKNIIVEQQRKRVAAGTHPL